MEDDAEAYLRHASKLQRKHFARGHSSVAPHERSFGRPAASLPVKKRKRTGDSDDDSDAPPPPAAAARVSPAPGDTSGGAPPARAATTLMEKWFPGRTLRNATLEAAQAPSLDYTDVAVARINAAREHVLLLRAGVEDILSFASVSSEGDVDSNRTDNWRWREMRDALTQLTLRDAFRTKKRVVRAVKWLLTTKASMVDVPKSPSLPQWRHYLSCHGPEQGCEPSQSLFVWLDSACTTVLFTALVQQMLRVYKQGMKAVTYTSHNIQSNSLKVKNNTNNNNNNNHDNNAEEEEEEEESEVDSQTDDTGDESEQETSTENKQRSAIMRLPALCCSSAGEDMVSLLSFLRVLMPVEVEDEVGNVTSRSAGYGVWLYACLSAVDIPLEPDLDRLVHELFRTCCRQIRTLGEAHGICGDTRGAILHAFSLRSEEKNSRGVQYNAISDVKREDVLAIHTIIIILAKLFRQNQNRLIPL